MTMMAFREVTITLGFWEDIPGFEKTDAEFRAQLAHLFSGAHVGGETTLLEAWEVNESDELIGRAI